MYVYVVNRDFGFAPAIYKWLLHVWHMQKPRLERGLKLGTG